jgi:hypothetical protein
MRLSRPSKFGFAPLMPVAKVGFSLPALPFSHPYRRPNCEAAKRNVGSLTQRVSAVDLRHTFLVKALKRRGILQPRPYVYLCLRCRSAFPINELRGSMVAVDRKAQPIPDPENSRRLATFAQGPCPALKSPTPPTAHETLELPRSRLRLSRSGILALIARTGALSTTAPNVVRALWETYQTYCGTV